MCINNSLEKIVYLFANRTSNLTEQSLRFRNLDTTYNMCCHWLIKVIWFVSYFITFVRLGYSFEHSTGWPSVRLYRNMRYSLSRTVLRENGSRLLRSNSQTNVTTTSFDSLKQIPCHSKMFSQSGLGCRPIFSEALNFNSR